MNKIINQQYMILYGLWWRILAILLIPLITVQTSCKKFVEVPPPPGTITENFVYTSDPTAIAVLSFIFTNFNGTAFQGNGSMPLFAGLASDEYQLNGGITSSPYIGYYENALTQTNTAQTSGAEHWTPLYNLVFRCNAAIEGLNKYGGSLTPVIKQQLLGEAKFVRAFLYFYLVNMYGDVPLCLTTDPQVSSNLSRTPKSDVYNQIVADLQDAEEKLSANYLDATLLNNTIQRVRPSKWAAAALLARVYLYKGEWAKAEEQSTQVINNTTLFSLPALLNQVFLKNSFEAIWQIQPTDLSYNTLDGTTLTLLPSGPSVTGSVSNPVQVSSLLMNSFEAGDKRAADTNWVGSVTVSGTTYRFANKYKKYLPDNNISGSNALQFVTEYFMVLRLAEQYLVRAEARAQLGNSSGAQADLNAIRNRAGLSNYTGATDKTSLLAAILHERQVELFSEWGHRWFDLKRTGNVDAVMTAATPLKSGGATSWQSYQQLYPLPLTELQKAPNLKQNPGYN